MRWVGLTGDEILSAHVYRGGVSVVVDYTRVCLFRLVAPPLQPGVMGYYSVRSAWFLNHVPLEGTGRTCFLDQSHHLENWSPVDGER
jgi:hypothetical protein